MFESYDNRLTYLQPSYVPDPSGGFRARWIFLQLSDACCSQGASRGIQKSSNRSFVSQYRQLEQWHHRCHKV
jgi:hypothetical protein